MNFILDSMTDLPYFVPLVLEGNKRGLRSIFFLKKDSKKYKKYNSPYHNKNAKFLVSLSNHLNIKLLQEDDVKSYHGLTFLLEGGGTHNLSSNHLIVSLVRLTDFTILYQKYINSVDFVIFPSEFIAKYYDKPWIYPIGNLKAGNTHTDKNLYLGCPKYDIIPSKEDVFKKIKQLNPSDKYCLIVAPQVSLMQKANEFKNLINSISKLGYKILVKARGKDPAPSYFRGDYYFEDSCWYPHDTMSLLTISDFYINFGSTVVKEGIMLKKPSINFELKSYRHFDFLFDQKFNVCFEDMTDMSKISEAINFITTNNFDEEFNRVQKKYIQPSQNSSKKIIDYFENLGKK